MYCTVYMYVYYDICYIQKIPHTFVTTVFASLRNDLYCVEWDVKLYYTIPYHTIQQCLNPANVTSRLGLGLG